MIQFFFQKGLSYKNYYRLSNQIDKQLKNEIDSMEDLTTTLEGLRKKIKLIITDQRTIKQPAAAERLQPPSEPPFPSGTDDIAHNTYRGAFLRELLLFYPEANQSFPKYPREWDRYNLAQLVDWYGDSSTDSPPAKRSRSHGPSFFGTNLDDGNSSSEESLDNEFEI